MLNAAPGTLLFYRNLTDAMRLASFRETRISRQKKILRQEKENTKINISRQKKNLMKKNPIFPATLIWTHKGKAETNPPRAA